MKFLGNNMVVKILTGGSYVAIGASTEDTLTWNNEQIDVTAKDSSRWTSLISAGARSVTVNMTGFISDETSFDELLDASKNDDLVEIQFEWANDQLVIGPFHVDTFEGTGAYGGAQGFTATLSSANEPMAGTIADFLQDEAGDQLLTETGEFLQGNY